MAKLRKLFFAALAILLIVEEWLWEILTAFGGILSRVLRLENFERWLAAAPPKTALIAFFIPLLIVTPINLFGLSLLARGHFLHGLAVELFAKILGMLLVARVFRLTRPQLLTFRWFDLGYHKILGWLNWAHLRVTSTVTYRVAKQGKESALQSLARLKAYFAKP
jgi:hypothetical protein